MTHNQVQWHLGTRDADIREASLEEDKKTNEYNKRMNRKQSDTAAAQAVGTFVATIIMCCLLL